MKIGDVELYVVSDGTIRRDGGALYGVAPKVAWNRYSPADKRNRVKLGLNCLVVRTGGKNILVDTGAGKKHPLSRRNMYAMKSGALLSGLRAHGLGADDIHLVVLTHLHFDHAGGSTRRSQTDRPVPTFPKASYLVQKVDWLEATNTTERTADSYIEEDFIPLEESRQIEYLDGDTEILPGVWLRVTGGHTGGHQALFVESGDRPAAFLGDVMPTAHHLPTSFATAWDSRPADTVEWKRRFLVQAEKDRRLLVFCHGVETVAGYLVRQNDSLTLDPQQL